MTATITSVIISNRPRAAMTSNVVTSGSCSRAPLLVTAWLIALLVWTKSRYGMRPNDQRLNDAALRAKALAETRQGPGRTLLRRCAVGEHDIVAVDGLQPAVQQMQHRLRGRFVIWMRMEERAA